MIFYKIIIDGKFAFTIYDREVAEAKVDWYNENEPDKEIESERIEVPADEVGLCFNDLKPVPEWCNECSVGAVRKMRSGTRAGFKDDGTCKTCPKFIPYYKLSEIYDRQTGH